MEMKELFKTKPDTDLSIFKGRKLDFSEFVDMLTKPEGAPQHENQACQVKLVDTCFFNEDGKPCFIARTDKDGFIQKITDPKRLGLN